jgi:hypothetical protein
MKWYYLSLIQWILLLIIVAFVDGFTVAQRYVIPEILRPLTYFVIVIVLLLVYFFIVHPSEPMVLAQTLSVILGAITIILILIQDVILTYSLSWKTIVVFMGAVLGPVIAEYLFTVLHAPESSKQI